MLAPPDAGGASKLNVGRFVRVPAEGIVAAFKFA
jgi:hypothetical protein